MVGTQVTWTSLSIPGPCLLPTPAPQVRELEAEKSEGLEPLLCPQAPQRGSGWAQGLNLIGFKPQCRRKRRSWGWCLGAERLERSRAAGKELLLWGRVRRGTENGSGMGSLCIPRKGTWPKHALGDLVSQLWLTKHFYGGYPFQSTQSL